MRKQETEKLSDKDFVIYALYILGGWQKRIHSEDIALKCFELAPSRFSWTKYPQYPDLQPVRFALEAVKKPKYGALVEGRSERKNKGIVGGWRLTENGIRWIEAKKSWLESCLGENISLKGRLSNDWRLKELLKSSAFKKFEKYGEKAEISHAEFADSLICTVNAEPKILNERLEQLYSAVETLKMGKVKNYINFCRIKFSSILR